MEQLNELPVGKLISKIKSMSNEELTNIISNNEFINFDDRIVNCFFLNGDSNIKDLFIENEILLNRLLKALLAQKTKLNSIDDEYQIKIIDKIESFLTLDENELYIMMNSMRNGLFEKFTTNLNSYLYNNNEIKTNNFMLISINELYNAIKNKDYDNYIVGEFIRNIKIEKNVSNDELLNRVCTKIFKGKRNIFELYNIKNEKQLYIFNKFGIVVNENFFNDIFDEEFNISIELLEKLNSKHVIRIIDELKEKDNNVDRTQLFITAIKMYCLFGLDNSLKIINDKFTYTTKASIARASNFNFNYERRNYRINHQDEFFNYGIIEKLKNSLSRNEKNIVKKISAINDKEYIIRLFNDLKEEYIVCKNDKTKTHYLIESVKEEINNREINKRHLYNADYYQKNMYNRRPITCIELFNLFKTFDTFKTEFDIHGNVVMNNKIKHFLLGNEKKDNDALLRMVFNRQALDYNIELINIINIFDQIQEILKDKNLGKNSLFYIMDIYKTLQYKLEIDEEDIPLSALSETLVSKKHLTCPANEAIDRLKEIHKERKKKCSSTIPRVKGVTQNNIRYKVLDKNDPEILTCGALTNCCFKAGGAGEEFYKYALTSKYSDVIALYDEDNNIYICPVIRNGNGVYGNSIEPENISPNKIESLLDALKKCYQEIMKKSNKKEKIEFCTLSNLHDYILPNKYKEIIINELPMLDGYFYNDITKNNVRNYILCGNADEIKYYKPKIEFEIERSKNYIYSEEMVDDKIIIEQKINEIEYTNQKERLTEEELEKFKENYKRLNVDDFDYVVYNEDWYIAMKNYELKSVCLTYDYRARMEFLRELTRISANYKLSNEIENNTKGRR